MIDIVSALHLLVITASPSFLCHLPAPAARALCIDFFCKYLRALQMACTAGLTVSAAEWTVIFCTAVAALQLVIVKKIFDLIFGGFASLLSADYWSSRVIAGASCKEIQPAFTNCLNGCF